MKFQPILNDMPISFAYNNPQYFRNKAREDRWGVPVYFVPSTNAYDERGQAYYGYVYESPCDEARGKYGNCTAWCMGRYHMLTNIVLKECIGDAFQAYAKYSGRKDGGNLNGQYIGDTIQDGDMLIYYDGAEGHINFVELVDGNILHISESGYSRNASYKGKACITYTLKREDMFTGRSISLRPQSPYSIKLYGVIHTGDVFEDFDVPEKVERDENKDQLYVEDISLNCRKEPSTKSLIYGAIGEGYYNVEEIKVGDDYTWYYLGNCWVAGVKETKYYPASKTINYKKMYLEAQDKLDKIREIINE